MTVGEVTDESVKFFLVVMSVINISLWRVGLYFIMYQFIMLSLGVGSAISSFPLFAVLSYHKSSGVCSIPFVCVCW